MVRAITTVTTIDNRRKDESVKFSWENNVRTLASE